jgi:hypothetical protein
MPYVVGMAQGYEQGSYRPGSYGGGGDTGGSAPAGSVPTGPRRARVGLIAFTAFLIELVIIAAGFNQAVTKHLVSYYDNHNDNSFVTSMVQAGLSLSWRLTPQHGDSSHIWLSELVGDVSILVLTVLLVVAVVRGAITWGRAFFGIWMIVIVSTCLASIPALLVTEHQAPAGVDKATYAVFGGPNGYVFFVGAALGLVVALITSIVAVATRRPGEALAPVFVPDETAGSAPEPPPPYYGDAAPAGWSQPSNQPAQGSRAEAPTTAYPVVAPGQSQPTKSPTPQSPPAQSPPAQSPPAQSPPAQSPPAQSEPTTTLPRLDDQWQPGQRSGQPVNDPPRNDPPKADLPPTSSAPPKGSTTTDSTITDGAPAANASTDSTTTLPRFTGGETGTWPPQSPPQSPAQSSSAPPAGPPASKPTEDQPTAAFPLPPDDEDLGQHPDHD